MSIMTVKDLKKKAPKGEFLAYINKKEADMLKRAGGSGHLVNGIPSFIGKDYANEREAKTTTTPASTNREKGIMSQYKGPKGTTGNITNFNDGSGAPKKSPPEDIDDTYTADSFNVTPKKNIFERFSEYRKKANKNWAVKQKQKQELAITKFLEEKYEISKYGSPRMIDIEEVKEQLRSQYDPTTNTMKGLEGFNTGKPGMNFGKTQLGPLGLKTTGSKGQPLSTKRLDQTPSLYSRVELPGMLGKLQGKPSINNLMSGFNKINQLTDIQKDGVTQGEITDYYDRSMGRGKYDIFGGGGDGDGPQPYLPISYNTGAAEIVEPYTNDFTYDENAFGPGGDSADVTRASYVFNKGGRVPAMEGGIMGTRARRAMGGIMNRVDQRQGYFLGKIVKSVKKVVGGVADAAGKVLKSDLGKAALLAYGAYYTGGKLGGAGGFDNFAQLGRSTMSGLGTLRNTFGLNKLPKEPSFLDKAIKFGKLAGGAYLLGKTKLGEAPVDQMPGGGERGGRLKDSQGNEALPYQLRAEIDDAYESGDPERIAAIEKYYAFLPPTAKEMPYEEFGEAGYRTTVATGGRIGYGLGRLVGNSVSASMSPGDTPSSGGASGMGGMIADLIRKNPNMFKRSKNTTPINQNNNGMYSKMFNNSQLFNQLSNNNDFIDENMNGIDDREETIMANGGRIRRAEGGLMDLGGMEKDYRAEGGFVPIGEYEKKDDVPARLSVNEFVFTADAVRGAGQGDIDKGAEIMENMMENLENGGTVSEESQGNKGAQQMFETSQRLGEVV